MTCAEQSQSMFIDTRVSAAQYISTCFADNEPLCGQNGYTDDHLLCNCLSTTQPQMSLEMNIMNKTMNKQTKSSLCPQISIAALFFLQRMPCPVTRQSVKDTQQ